MKSTGIVRKLDDLGRIVLPRELRETIGIISGDLLEIWVDSDKSIRLRKYIPEQPDLAQEMARLQNYINESGNADNDKIRWIKAFERVRKQIQFAECMREVYGKSS